MSAAAPDGGGGFGLALFLLAVAALVGLGVFIGWLVFA